MNCEQPNDSSNTHNGSGTPDDTDIEILFRKVQLYDVTVNFGNIPGR